MNAQPLDIARLPLQGLRLIEASAGTGKTYTIALLYLRLVLGHGVPKPMMPPDILVLTFTEAAAAELRDRIRSRLAAAARCCRGEATADPALAAILADYPAAEWPLLAFLLEQAADWLDESAIGTIHGWCLRMLQQHAFDSGSPFAVQLLMDAPARREQVLLDLWRAWFYPLPAAAASEVAQALGSPLALSRRLGAVLALPAVRICRDGDSATAGWRDSLQAVLDLQRQQAARWQAVADCWATDGETLRDALSAAADAGHLKRNIYRSDSLAALFRHMDAVQAGEETPLPARLLLWSSDKLAAARSKQGQPVQLSIAPPIDDWLAGAGTLAAARERLQLALLSDLADAARHTLLSQALQAGELSFDDLLQLLHRSLQGAAGEALVQRLRGRYPVALIDEFQDTDPIQFGIFQRLYEAAPARALLMIGDPKQAIYSFRGADLPTYLRARAAAETPHYALTVNYRSDRALVSAVNALLQLRPVLDYVPVTAHHETPGLWQRRGEDWMPLQPFHLLTADAGAAAPDSLAKGAARQWLAGHCAEQIAHWLREAAAGRLCHVSAGVRQPLQPGDIAVLVRSRQEAQVMQAALRARGVPTVFGSARDAVYDTPEAGQLQRWLESWQRPQDEAALRLALATPVLAADTAWLAGLRQDEQAWEAQLALAEACQQQWRQAGVLAAVRHWLFAHGVPARLLAQPGGERALTNLLQLAELLQAAAVVLAGEHALVRFLAEQRAAADRPGDDAALMRLESDSARVRLVTLHQSKGLEYPLVCLPFLSLPGGLRPDEWRRYHDDHGRLCLDLASGKDSRSQSLAEAEQLQEELRLCYVGLTRARHLLWTALIPVTQGQSKALLPMTPWAQLLTGQPVFADAAQLQAALAEVDTALAPWLQRQSAALGERPPVSVCPSTDETVPLQPARQASGRLPPRWWIASYSALALAEPAVAAPETPQIDRLRELQVTAALPAVAGLPRGAETGVFWHALLELAGEFGFGREPAQREQLLLAAQQRCQQQGLPAEDSAVLLAALARWLRQPLPLPGGDAVALSALTRYRVELGFWLPCHQVPLTRLDQLIQRYCLPGQPRPALQPGQLNGLLKGFIDLVFCHQGRYYVLDYKSNDLGPSPADYGPEGLQRSLLAHRYDVQYVLYALALHRQLKVRLPDYALRRHLGGAVYVYLRGLDAHGQGVFTDGLDPALIESLDALLGEARPC